MKGRTSKHPLPSVSPNLGVASLDPHLEKLRRRVRIDDSRGRFLIEALSTQCCKLSVARPPAFFRVFAVGPQASAPGEAPRGPALDIRILLFDKLGEDRSGDALGAEPGLDLSRGSALPAQAIEGLRRETMIVHIAAFDQTRDGRGDPIEGGVGRLAGPITSLVDLPFEQRSQRRGARFPAGCVAQSPLLQPLLIHRLRVTPTSPSRGGVSG